MLRQKVAGLDTALRAQTKVRADCRLLMIVPGVGAITALAFASAIDDPARFRRSRDSAISSRMASVTALIRSGERRRYSPTDPGQPTVLARALTAHL